MPSIFESIVDESGNRVESPLGVHQTFTNYFTRAFSTPDRHQEGIHDEFWPWQTGGDKEDFLRRVQHHAIPVHLLDTDAIKQSPEAPLVNTELARTHFSLSTVLS